MIKVFKISPEDTDSTCYFDFEGWEDVILDGNRDAISMHTDYNLYDRINRYCIEYNELQDAIYEAGTRCGTYKSATEAIEDLLEFKPTTMQVHKIKSILEKADNDYPRTDFDKLMTDLLSACEKRIWTHKTIRGYCQRDWQTIYYPVDSYSDDFINYIESLYFNTGTEVCICETDGENDSCDPWDYDDNYYNYYAERFWNDDLLKEQIAKDTGDSDVVIYEPHKVTTTMWDIA